MKRLIMCVVVLICMGCMLFLTGCVVNIHGENAGSTFDYEDAESYTVGGGSAAGTVKNLEIEWVSGKVNVSVSETNEITLAETANKDVSQDLTMRWKVDGDTLRVKFCNAGSWKTNGLEKELTVTLPENMELDTLEIETVSGDVDIVMDRVKTMQADTVSGSVTAAAEECREADLDTVSGEIRLNLAKVSGDCEIETVSGDVTLAVPGDSDFTLRYDTVSGDADSDIPLKKDGKQYIVGSGKHSFRVDTTSGNLSITELK